MNQPSAAPASPETSVPRLIGAGLTARILIDTGVQMLFPFLPVFAAGLGTTAVTVGRLVSIRSLMGLLAPAASPVTERRGYRFTLRTGLLLAGLGYLLLAASTNLWTAMLAMILAGLGSFTFVPTLQAYLSAYLPYKRRARGLGTVELGWALSGIVGLFLVGELIARTSWRVPPAILGAGLLLMALLYGLLPATPVSARPQADPEARPLAARLSAYMQLGSHGRSAWSAVTVNGLVMLAAMHTFISYGSWLVDSFGLGPAALGRVALTLGIADFIGASLVTLASDRIGKRRSFILATAGGAAAFLLLAWLGGVALTTAVGGLFLARFAFEFSLVSLISLLSEQVPSQRSKVMALATASALIGTAVAGLTGPWAYARFGLVGLALPSAVMMLASCLAVMTAVWERAEP